MPLRPLLAAVVAAITFLLAARAADADAGKAKAEACVACHGPDGVSQTTEIPSLAGQPDAFLQWQLVYFRAGTRENPAMAPIVGALSDADIRALGAYFAALPPPKPPQALDEVPALTAASAKLAKQSGATCHTESFAGNQAVARLAGQREDYLLKALRDFKSGKRMGGGVATMPDVVYPLGEDDFKALAHFLARQPG